MYFCTLGKENVFCTVGKENVFLHGRKRKCIYRPEIKPNVICPGSGDKNYRHQQVLDPR